MHKNHTYDLAFVAPNRRPFAPPEIVFIVDERHMDEIVTRLSKVVCAFNNCADAYLPDTEASFNLPTPDLFDNKEFGYRNCGYWTIENTKVHLRFPLRPDPWAMYCTLSIFMLVKALDSPFAEAAPSNRTQDVSLLTLCELGRFGGYGHAIGGWFSENILRWLREYAQGKVRAFGILEAAPMHPEVIRAMQATWHNIATGELKQYASSREVYGWIRENGSFSLNCFGDACDIGIYPDQWLDEGCELVEFGCHNLDTAYQQLTLLAGVAKLCQLAREGV